MEITLYFEQVSKALTAAHRLNQKIKAGDVRPARGQGPRAGGRSARINLDIAQLGLQRAIANGGRQPDVKTSAARSYGPRRRARRSRLDADRSNEADLRGRCRDRGRPGRGTGLADP